MSIPELATWIVDQGCERDESGCLIWQGRKLRTGYGAIQHEGKTVNPHRIVLIHYKGEPASGMVCRHHCDNRLCCDPLHMDWGTIHENRG